MIIISLISLILDGLFNIYFSNSYLMSLFSIITLIYSYFFFENKKYYLYYSIIYGIIYDIFFTNFYILNMIVFFLLANFIISYFKKFTNNIIYILILNTLIIFLYQFILLVIFHLTFYNNITLKEFIFIFPHFLFINTIYGIILFLNNNRIVNKNKHIIY